MTAKTLASLALLATAASPLLAMPSPSPVYADDDDDSGSDGVPSMVELDSAIGDVEKPPVFKGKFVGEVQEVKEATSGKGNTYYAILFKVSANDLPPEAAEAYEEGLDLYWNRQLKPGPRTDRRTIYNLRKLMEALGQDTSVSTFDPNDWVGARCNLTVTVSKFRGEERMEIAALSKLESAPARARRQAEPEPGDEDDDQTRAAPRTQRGGRR